MQIEIEQKTEALDLEGWPTFALSTAKLRHITLDELREAIAGGSDEASFYAVQTAPGGSVAPRILNCIEYSDQQCHAFLQNYLDVDSSSWEPEYLFLINQPCYIAVGSGVVFLSDGRVIVDTLFPTDGVVAAPRSIEGCIGGGLWADIMVEEIRQAQVLDRGLWAPLHSRWNNAYCHAISESIVQDSIFRRLGLSRSVFYAATAWPNDSRRFVMSRAHSPIMTFYPPLVQAPKAIFASKLYRHRPLGQEFVNTIEEQKARALRQSQPPAPAGRKIYISRLGVDRRRMTNEAELMAELSRMGFDIVAPQNMPFEEQVRLFMEAKFIAGPYGSGLINAAFAAPGTTLCELRPLNAKFDAPLWDDYFLRLAAACGLQYAVYIASNTPEVDEWKCDIPNVVGLVDKISREIE